MIFSLAPMEGLTGYIVRNAFHHNFDFIDKYYTPFIPAAKRMNSKIKRDLDPSNNDGTFQHERNIGQNQGAV